jgi:hypothetical protein
MSISRWITLGDQLERFRRQRRSPNGRVVDAFGPEAIPVATGWVSIDLLRHARAKSRYWGADGDGTTTATTRSLLEIWISPVSDPFRDAFKLRAMCGRPDRLPVIQTPIILPVFRDGIGRFCAPQRSCGGALNPSYAVFWSGGPGFYFSTLSLCPPLAIKPVRLLPLLDIVRRFDKEEIKNT